jgi:flagellar hook-basal body complex protein FliE
MQVSPSSPSEVRVSESLTQGAGPGAPSAPGVPGADDKTFSEIFKESMDQVNTYQHQANEAIHELVAGRSKNIHETLLTIERADTSLKLMMQVRNKILDAYKEIMRMQV